MNKITEDFLIKEGFTDTGKTHGYNKIWRKPLRDSNNYGFFNFVMGDYQNTNPNIGVLGIYYPEEEVSSVPDDLVGKDTWTNEDMERAANYKIKVNAQLVNFAFYLDDQERFKRLIEDISFIR